MKKLAIASIAGAALLFAGAGAYALYARYTEPEVEIGAVKLGMTANDYKSLTFGGISSLQFGSVVPLNEPEVKFRDGKLDSFRMDFFTYRYEYMRDALKAKYPSMSCEQVKGVFPHDFERCRVGSTLVLAQGEQGGRASTLLLWSLQYQQDKQRAGQLFEKQQKGI
jgi:hypothetical protein